MSVSLYSAATGQDPFQGVVKMWIYVDGPDLNPLEHQVEALYAPGGGVTLPTIPFSTTGQERQLTIEGWGVDQTTGGQYLVSRGRTLSSVIAEGALVPHALSAFFARVNAFSPLADAATRQPQALFQGRVGHTAVRTALDEVVITGGGVASGAGTAWWDPAALDSVLRTSEILDEATNTLRPLAVEMFFDRAWHTATPISTGQVFFAGGWGTINGARQALSGVEVYQPVTAQNPIEKIDVLQHQLSKARAGHSATLIDEKNFVVLFVGGDVDGDPTFEVWNPFTGTTGARSLPDKTHRRFHAATYFEATDPAQPLGSAGRPAVIIVGGETSAELASDEVAKVLDSFLIYDILTDSMLAQPGDMPKGARTQPTATWVPNQGKIYVAGGYTSADRSTASNAIDVFEAASNTPSFKQNVAGFNLKSGRGGHTATLMNDGAVLIAGGSDASGALPSIEIIRQYFKQEADTAGNPILIPYITVAFSCDEADCPYIPDMPAARVGTGPSSWIEGSRC